MSGLCLWASATVLALGPSVTVSWTHSVQKSPWEEVYEWKKEQMVLTHARITSTGAGMEPPDDAIFDGQYWHFQPNRVLTEVLFQHSPYVDGYTLCTNQRCEKLNTWMPALKSIEVVKLAPCSAQK